MADQSLSTLSWAAEGGTAGQGDKQPTVGLLAAMVVMVTAIMIAAVFTLVYIYNNPTSSISLFFIEVSLSFLCCPTCFHIYLPRKAEYSQTNE